ncbi:hypothetical protein DFH09DRAFT_1440027 [Mycena vulgaris]|nr:hypothetical protein DFH09DRAFT_1440027 [Mycena vulgaris]
MVAPVPLPVSRTTSSITPPDSPHTRLLAPSRSAPRYRSPIFPKPSCPLPSICLLSSAPPSLQSLRRIRPTRLLAPSRSAETSESDNPDVPRRSLPSLCLPSVAPPDLPTRLFAPSRSAQDVVFHSSPLYGRSCLFPCPRTLTRSRQQVNNVALCPPPSLPEPASACARRVCLRAYGCAPRQSRCHVFDSHGDYQPTHLRLHAVDGGYALAHPLLPVLTYAAARPIPRRPYLYCAATYTAAVLAYIAAPVPPFSSTLASATRYPRSLLIDSTLSPLWAHLDTRPPNIAEKKFLSYTKPCIAATPTTGTNSRRSSSSPP